MEMKVNVKSVSGKRNRITTVSVPYNRDAMSVRELIEETVNYCVSEYNSRMENTELLSALRAARLHGSPPRHWSVDVFPEKAGLIYAKRRPFHE